MYQGKAFSLSTRGGTLQEATLAKQKSLTVTTARHVHISRCEVPTTIEFVARIF